jgi:hypothetical protein
MKIKEKNISWGFNKKSERLNGQLAMMGLVIVIIVEFFMNISIL